MAVDGFRGAGDAPSGLELVHALDLTAACQADKEFSYLFCESAAQYSPYEKNTAAT
jgi:hypothetical protein